jgi:hypothetical protein
LPTPDLRGALEIGEDGILGGFVGCVDYVEDVLQINTSATKRQHFVGYMEDAQHRAGVKWR